MPSDAASTLVSLPVQRLYTAETAAAGPLLGACEHMPRGAPARPYLEAADRDAHATDAATGALRQVQALLHETGLEVARLRHKEERLQRAIVSEGERVVPSF